MGHGGKRPYRCEATTVEGFIQQVAVSYLARGYWFYVAGQVPEGKDPRAVDRKLIGRYGIDASPAERARRKQAGFSNMQYIRNGKFFLLLATHGRHRFFEDERGQIRDARRVSIKYAGYSLSLRSGRVCVRIQQEEYKRLKAHFLDLACRRSVATLASEFRGIRFVPYAPVRQQLLQIWRSMNRSRKVAGYAPVPVECVPWRRPIVKPFEELGVPVEVGGLPGYAA